MTFAQPAPTTSSESANVPGLAAQVTAFIGLVSAKAAPFAGFDAYQLTLSTGGTGWAIKGTPAAVVPEVLADATYSETASVLFLSGDYVLYFHRFSQMPAAVIDNTGPFPGMTVIDTDLYV